MPEKKKYFKFNIDFETEEDRDNFKNYVHHIKTGKGIPIYRTAIDMMELHKLYNSRKETLKK